jgi:hypothetical protein
MKKSILTAAIMISLMITQSCKTEVKTEVKKEETPGMPVKRLLTSSFHVPLAEAQVNIARYVDKCTELFGNVPIRAYTIHGEDLMEALGMDTTEPIPHRYSHIRAYLGLDSLSNFKLYLTPVEGANLAAVPKIAGTDVILSDESGEYVLDLNAPCPATCDITSPLYYDNISKTISKKK